MSGLAVVRVNSKGQESKVNVSGFTCSEYIYMGERESNCLLGKMQALSHVLQISVPERDVVTVFLRPGASHPAPG